MDLATFEAELRAILVPYEDVLEAADIYGMEVLRRPGAKAHDWFAGVRTKGDALKFMLLPMHTHPDLLEDVSAGAPEAKSGASVLTLRVGDEGRSQSSRCSSDGASTPTSGSHRAKADRRPAGGAGDRSSARSLLLGVAVLAASLSACVFKGAGDPAHAFGISNQGPETVIVRFGFSFEFLVEPGEGGTAVEGSAPSNARSKC